MYYLPHQSAPTINLYIIKRTLAVWPSDVSEYQAPQVERVNDLLHKFEVADTGLDRVDLLLCQYEVSLEQFVDATICHERTHLFQFACIQPDTVVTAFIDHHTGDALEILA